ncbi:MAG: esterase [Proteobacteria bacterium]|nr:esterase [Pseudomonadota bacterium]
MNKRTHVWRSPSLGIEMPVAVYGHWGVPMLFFPTAAADFEEYERFGLIGDIASHIERGAVKVYSINTINNKSWFDENIHPAERARRQALYDQYVREEVVPFIHADCGSWQPICTVGASMGAYHALNTLCKHPTQFKWCIGMSGIYDMRRYMDGYFDENCYFNNPPDFVGGMSDHASLEMLRSCSINLIVGRGPYEHIDWTQHATDALWNRGVSVNMDLWGHDSGHDWPWWKRQLNVYIPKLFG